MTAVLLKFCRVLIFPARRSLRPNRSTTSGSRATYERFWSSITSVDVRQATGSAPGSGGAPLRYVFDDGRRYEERTSYSLVDDGGTLKIDRSSVLSSRRL